MRYEMKLDGVWEISISLGRETLISVTTPLTVVDFAAATTQQRCAIFDRSARSPFLAAPPFRCPLSEPSVPSLFTS